MSELRGLDEHRSRVEDIKARLTELHNENEGVEMPDEARDEWNALNEEREAVEKSIEELEARERVIATLDETKKERPSFQTRKSQIVDNINDLWQMRQRARNEDEYRTILNESARKHVEKLVPGDPAINKEDAQERVSKLLARDSADGEIAQRIIATGTDTYRRAFGKVISGREHAMTTEERTAMSTSGSAGGYAVPYTLDPSVIATSNFSVNPFRLIARVVPLVGSNTWQGISSAGVTASFDNENAEVSDDSPTFSQPAATAYSARAFVQFSMEIDDDWGSLQSEMTRLFQDAKDDLEATAFTTGSGTAPNPLGITETANASGVGTASFVFTAGTAAFAVGDVYSLEQALAPRWRPRASFVANRATYNKIRQFDTAGGASLWQDNLRVGLANNVPTSGQIGSSLLGYPAYEDSVLSSTPTTTGQKTIVFGDFSQYVIVDRIGMSVEVIPHLFNTNANLPSGTRGLFARWRVGATVAAPTAFKILKVL